MASGQIPASQTAPIDEYRVFWTSQKKQKLKKWQDGFLRFHTYNKRMIVYDETRTLVCDMYLQRAERVNEGDEFEFEHHLVTVEEFKGRVVQDLTAIMSPIIERRQQRQVQSTHSQHPLYPGRNVRLDTSGCDSPLPTRQNQPKTPLQAPSMGGIGEAAHVSLSDILKRSNRQQHAVYTTAMRTPTRGPTVSGTSRVSIGLPTPGSVFKGDETPTRSTYRKDLVRPLPELVAPLHFGKQTEDLSISAIKTTSSTTVTSCNAPGPRKHTIPSHSSFGDRLAMECTKTPKVRSGSTHLFKTPQTNDSRLGNRVAKAQPQYVVEIDSHNHIPASIPSASHTHNRLTFKPPAPSPTNHATTSGFDHNARLQIPDDDGVRGVVPPEKESVLPQTRKPYKRPIFTTDRAMTSESSSDIHMGDVSPVRSRERSPLGSKGRKRDSESRPTATIKLATAKRKMLISRQPARREKSAETLKVTGALTKEEVSEQKLSDDSDATGQDIMSLGEMAGDGLKHRVKPKMTAAFVTSTQNVQLASEHRPHEHVDGVGNVKRTPGNRASVEVEYRSFESSVLVSAQNKKVVPRSISTGEKGGCERKNNEKGEKGETDENEGADNSSLLSEGCVDLTATPGKADEPGDLTLSSSPTINRRDRKKRTQPRAQEHQITKEKEAEGLGKTCELGPWSVEAFDLFEWRPPGFVNG